MFLLYNKITHTKNGRTKQKGDHVMMKTREKTYTIQLTERELGQVVLAMFAFDPTNKELQQWREWFEEEYEEVVVPMDRQEFYRLYDRLLNRYLGKEAD